MILTPEHIPQRIGLNPKNLMTLSQTALSLNGVEISGETDATDPLLKAATELTQAGLVMMTSIFVHAEEDFKEQLVSSFKETILKEIDQAMDFTEKMKALGRSPITIERAE